jgi:putative ABC transport system permease protein
VSSDYGSIKRWGVAEGRFLDVDEVAQARTVVVLGSTVRQELFGEEEALGKIVRIDRSEFFVVGVLEPKGANEIGQDQDDAVFVPWTAAAQRLVSRSLLWLDDIMCSATSSDDVGEAEQDVSDLLRQRHRIAADGRDDFNVRHPADVLRSKHASQRTVSMLATLLALLSLAIAAVGVANLLISSVSQRTREFGIRAAVGASPAALVLQIVFEGAWLATGGTLLGLAAASCMAAFGPSWMVPSSGFHTAVLFRIAGVVALVTLSAVMYPAIQAARLDPAIALATPR